MKPLRFARAERSADLQIGCSAGVHIGNFISLCPILKFGADRQAGCPTLGASLFLRLGWVLHSSIARTSR